MIITIAAEKGGAGKSTLAQNLSVWLLTVFNRSVVLYDADPQMTTASWRKARLETNLPMMEGLAGHGKIGRELINLNQKYDCVIVDCGGSDSVTMRQAIGVSDIACLPFRPKRRDLATAMKMAEICTGMQSANPKLQVRSVLTQVPTLPSQMYRVDQAKQLLFELGLNPLQPHTRNLNAWDDAEEGGSSVFEFNEGMKSKAAQDATLVFDGLLRGGLYCGG